MKLLSLHIEKYKNLSGTYDFTSQDGYIALIGENGSGKSNLLEAISLIFGKLYDIPDVQEIGKFWIKYELDGNERIYGNIDEEGNDIQLVQSPQLPSSIISCYSGEDQRLWDSIYHSYYIDFFNNAISGESYVPKLLYINKYCWKIALIALLYSENTDVHDLLTDKLNINSENVKIKFTKKEQSNIKSHDASNWYKQVQEILGTEDFSLESLKDIDLNYTQNANLSPDQRIFYYLYFLSMPKKDERSGLRADKLIEDITITINGINFNNLSEGEKKLILIECITKVLADKNSVLLFDEPDAHTHIARKKDILKAIELSESQTILTTHSPIFINHMVNNNIYPIDNGHVINAEQRDLITKLANNSINYIDGACLISSKHLVLTEGPGDINYITAAIKACGKNDNQYKALENVSFAYIGGANLVSEYYKEILSHLYRTLDRVIFVFDLDNEGREGARQAQQLINEGKDKIKVIYYNSTYPIVDPNNSDFYVEDMFPRRIYSIINLPNINGVPTYAQLKKGSTWANNIKNKIADLYKKQLLKDEDYYHFKPFLLQLKQELGL